MKLNKGRTLSRGSYTTKKSQATGIAYDYFIKIIFQNYITGGQVNETSTVTFIRTN